MCTRLLPAGRLLRLYGQLFLLTLLVFPPHLWAATITVTDGTSTVADDGVCSLREAITAANTDSASGASPGECPAGSGADTVVLTGDVGLSNIDNYGPSGDRNGLPLVTSAVTIAGNGFQVDRVGLDFRFFEVLSSGTLTLNDVTLNAGYVYYAYYGKGGAIHSSGSLTLNNSHVTESRAPYGGAIYVSSSGSATLTNSTVTGNASYGSSIDVRYGELTVTDSTVEDGIFVESPGLTPGATTCRPPGF